MIVFSSGFAESTCDVDMHPDPAPSDEASVSEFGAFAQHFDDSDFEDEDDDPATLDNDNDFQIDDPNRHDRDPQEQDGLSGHQLGEDVLPTPLTKSAATPLPSGSNKRISISGDETHETQNVLGPDACDETDQSARNTRAKLSHPSTPRSRGVTPEQEAQLRSPPPRAVEISQVQRTPDGDVPGPKKARVVVKDVAYTTYRAVLYYVCSQYLSV